MFVSRSITRFLFSNQNSVNICSFPVQLYEFITFLYSIIKFLYRFMNVFMANIREVVGWVQKLWSAVVVGRFVLKFTHFFVSFFFFFFLRRRRQWPPFFITLYKEEQECRNEGILLWFNSICVLCILIQ